MALHFLYGEKEIQHLKKADKRLADVIDFVGKIEREVNPDLFSALVDTIIGQQISSKAHRTIWARMQTELGEITPAIIANLPLEKLQKFGISFRKAEYIQAAAQKILRNEFDINLLHALPDDEVSAKLTELKGIGPWTAEMLMIFSMQRPDILSYGDLAIQRGMKMLYRLPKIDQTTFGKYRKQYSPYGTVASLYIWAVAGGAIDGLEEIG